MGPYDARPKSSVRATTRRFDYIVENIKDADLRERVSNARIVLLPSEMAAEYEGSVFPQGTKEFFDFLQSQGDIEGPVEAAANDEDYVEFTFHADWLIVPIIYVAQSLALPTVVSLIASYIYDKLKYRERTRVSSELQFKNSEGQELSFKYDGPPSEFERVAKAALAQFIRTREKG